MSCHQTLKEQGYRLTPQRTVILNILHASDTHLTAEDIYEQAQAKCPKVNRSTVYRTLELLNSLGLVDETDLGDDKLYYHHVERGHHHHLICQKCGRVFDVGEEIFDPFKEIMIHKYNFLPDMRHLAIFGHCLTCR